MVDPKKVKEDVETTVTAELLERHGKLWATRYLRSQPSSCRPQLLRQLLGRVLSPLKPINDEAAVDWLRWLMSGEHTPEAFAEQVRQYDNAQRCGMVWTADFVAYRCRTCGVSPCMSLCAECFQRGNHEGHDYNMFRSQAGGACDCGDPYVMKESGFCSLHGQLDASRQRRPPDSLMEIPRLMLPFIFRRLLIYLRMNSRLMDESSSESPSSLMLRLDVFLCYLQELCSMRAAMRSSMTSVLVSQQLYMEMESEIVSLDDPHLSSDIAKLVQEAYRNYLEALNSMPTLDLPAHLRALSPALGEQIRHHSMLDELVFWTYKYEFPTKLVCFLLNMLPEQKYKECFARAFVVHYARISQMLAASNEPDPLTNRVVHVSVQLFSNELLAVRMTDEMHLLHAMIVSLTYMTSRILVNCQLHDLRRNSHMVANCADKIMKNHCYWPLVSDLSNVLGHRPVSLYFLADDHLLDMWFLYLSMYQGMNVNFRQLDTHVDVEPSTYYAAFSAELEGSATPMWALLAHLREPGTAHLSKRLLRHAYSALQKWHDNIGCPQTYEEIVNDTSTDLRCTFHLPLHRYVALIISEATKRQRLTLHELLPSHSMMITMVSHLLKLQVSFYEICAGLWVRNGIQMRGQTMTYTQCHFCCSMVDPDIYLLQLGASTLDPDRFLTLILKKFHVWEWLSFAPNATNSFLEPDQQIPMMEACLTFLATLLCVRTCGGMGEEEMARLEIATQLCMSDKTHSQLTELLPEKSETVTSPTLFETALAQVSRYRGPASEASGNMQQGIYGPKPEVWNSLYDPIYVMLRAMVRKEFQTSMDRFTAFVKSTGQYTDSRTSPWPPYRVPTTSTTTSTTSTSTTSTSPTADSASASSSSSGSTSAATASASSDAAGGSGSGGGVPDVRRLLRCSTFYGAMLAILRRCVLEPTVSEQLMALTVFLLEIAVREPEPPLTGQEVYCASSGGGGGGAAFAAGDGETLEYIDLCFGDWFATHRPADNLSRVIDNVTVPRHRAGHVTSTATVRRSSHSLWPATGASQTEDGLMESMSVEDEMEQSGRLYAAMPPPPAPPSAPPTASSSQPAGTACRLSGRARSSGRARVRPPAGDRVHPLVGRLMLALRPSAPLPALLAGTEVGRVPASSEHQQQLQQQRQQFEQQQQQHEQQRQRLREQLTQLFAQADAVSDTYAASRAERRAVREAMRRGEGEAEGEEETADDGAGAMPVVVYDQEMAAGSASGSVSPHSSDETVQLDWYDRGDEEDDDPVVDDDNIGDDGEEADGDGVSAAITTGGDGGGVMDVGGAAGSDCASDGTGAAGASARRRRGGASARGAGGGLSVAFGESIVSLLLKLHSKLSGHIDSYRLPSDHQLHSMTESRVGNGSFFVGQLLSFIARKDPLLKRHIVETHSRLWPKAEEEDTIRKEDREARRRMARERQQRLMRQFANKQRQFQQQMETEIGGGSASSGAAAASHGVRSRTAPSHHQHQQQQPPPPPRRFSSSVAEEEYDCVICGQSGSATAAATAAGNQWRPFGLVVLLQASSVLAHQRVSDHQLQLPVDEASCRQLRQQFAANRAGYVEKVHERLAGAFDDKSWLLTLNIGVSGGVHVQTCGHHLHLDCHRLYVSSLSGVEARQQGVSLQRGEFSCPLCRQQCNCVLPLLDSVADDNSDSDSFAADSATASDTISPQQQQQQLQLTSALTHETALALTQHQQQQQQQYYHHHQQQQHHQQRQRSQQGSASLEMYRNIYAMLSTAAPTEYDKSFWEPISKAMENMTHVTYPRYRNTTPLSPGHENVLLFVASIARTNLEMELVQRGGRLVGTGDPTSQLVPSVKRSSLRPLLTVLGFNAKMLSVRLAYRYLPAAWAQLTGLDRLLSATAAAAAAVADVDSSSMPPLPGPSSPAAAAAAAVVSLAHNTANMYQPEVPMLVRDPSALLILLVLTVAWPPSRPLFSCLVQSLYNLVVVQACVCVSLQLPVQQRLQLVLDYLVLAEPERTPQCLTWLMGTVISVLRHVPGLYDSPDAPPPSSPSPSPSPPQTTSPPTPAAAEATESGADLNTDTDVGAGVSAEGDDSSLGACAMDTSDGSAFSYTATATSSSSSGGGGGEGCVMAGTVAVAGAGCDADSLERQLVQRCLPFVRLAAVLQQHLWPQRPLPALPPTASAAAELTALCRYLGLPAGGTCCDRLRWLDLGSSCSSPAAAAAAAAGGGGGSPVCTADTLPAAAADNLLSLVASSSSSCCTSLASYRQLAAGLSDQLRSATPAEAAASTGAGGTFLPLARVWCEQLRSVALQWQPSVARDLLQQPRWHQPRLLQLPHQYKHIFLFYHRRQCARCGTVPKEPTVCLVCGTLVCLRGQCCKQQHANETVVHSVQCGAGTSIFLAVDSCMVIVIRGRRACLWGSVYLDSFGEEDRELKRGRPLFLCQERYDLLQNLWLAHAFDNTRRRWIWHKEML